MKRFVLAVVLCVALCGVVRAEEMGVSDIIAKMPVTNAGMYFNVEESNFEFLSTFKAAGWKGFNINIGYATPEALAVVLGYQITKLQDLGLDMPILKDMAVDVGAALTWEEPLNDREFGYGPAITFTWKW